MMFFRSVKKGFSDSGYCYIVIAAVMACLFMAFMPFMMKIYEYGFVIPCMLWLGIQRERGKLSENRKSFILPGIMVAWFLLLQVKRGAEEVDVRNIGLFITVYLFAFPLASVLREQNGNRTLKLFAGAYVTAAAVLAANGLMLIINRLPEFMVKHVAWDGARLMAVWHPNIVGCYLMIGIIFCTIFLMQAKSVWTKIGLAAVLAMMTGMMAVTSSRTATILTGGYFGSVLFYILLRRGRKWFIPAVLAALIVTAAFYSAERCLFNANSDRLIRKYTQQYAEQIAANLSAASVGETELPPEEVAAPEETVVYAEPETDVTETVQEDTSAEVTMQQDVIAEEAVQEEIPAEEAIPAEEIYYEAEEYLETPEEEQPVQLPITIDPESGEIHLVTESLQGDIAQDFGTFNSRTYIWSAAKFAIRENPSILYWGIHNPGEHVSAYNFFPIGHLHNAWIECLVGMGVVGLLMAVVFTLMTVWNALIVLLKHYQDVWKRSAAILVLCLLVASVLEPYLFYTTISYHLTDFIFFLCAGYLAYWQEEDNRRILLWIRSRLSFLKNKQNTSDQHFCVGLTCFSVSKENIKFCARKRRLIIFKRVL